ncbi:hypothetical protein SERLADRAFT_405857 [Serpula lacrymans var. lacrymans S7.9]|uniref:Uncharacterized protein n=1 Tax=Serpula lacrymans var. lacrymans (strain S7.9) TaxID=578457 RepID=F8NLN7_SERL9|nr:uncharacterized protein SERLADRAFT_405857 [Serpula lacrymans var. lacrymans S7.9]EGO28218.1 hypothetical protein SERLADRAFT_405857 [Serpula lacrymans var. lacrymans S7.9]
MWVARALKEKAHAVQRASEKAIEKVKATGLGTFMMKEKGNITETARGMLRDLVAFHNVPAAHAGGVVSMVTAAVGVTVKGRASKRSIGQIALEGGEAANIQAVDEIVGSKGITLSGDGTTHKYVNYESRHIMFTTSSGEKVNCAIGVHSAINHTSETQLEGWWELILEMYRTYNVSSRAKEYQADPREFYLAVKGVSMDHAEDQKKFEKHHAPSVAKATWETISAAGGLEVWHGLSNREREVHLSMALCAIHIKIGQEEFDGLSDIEKDAATFSVFLGVVKDKKEKCTLTNIKKNVLTGLLDPETNSKMCPLAIYSQIITIPFMQQVRGPTGEHTIVLDLGPLLIKVIAHCTAIVADPDLVLAPDARYQTATLDGQPFERPKDCWWSSSTVPRTHGSGFTKQYWLVYQKYSSFLGGSKTPSEKSSQEGFQWSSEEAAPRTGII